MSNTPVLNLPEIADSSLSKNVIHNQALRQLEAFLVRVKDKDLATPPGSPAEGDSYIVASSPTGAWVGHTNHMAAFIGGTWVFYTPLEGVTVWVNDEDIHYTYTGSAWGTSGSGSVTTVSVVSANGFSGSVANATTTPAITLTLTDAELSAIAGLTSAANKIPYFTGSGTASLLTRDTDTTLAGNSDTNIATQKAVKTYVDGIVTGGASDVMIFKGVIDASANPNYPAADAGNLYKISVAGKIGGASGINVEVGDTIYCITDGTASGTQAAVGANWVISQVNLDGAVIGPASVTDSHVVGFDGTTGKLIKDLGAASSLSVSSAATLTTPRTIGGTSFNGSADITQPYDVGGFYPGIPTASAKVLRAPIPRAVTFPANFSGSYFSASANATGTTVFDVAKNGSTIGSISIAAGGIVATFTTTSGTSKSFAAGDVLQITCPGTPDATLADIGIILAGTR